MGVFDLVNLPNVLNLHALNSLRFWADTVFLSYVKKSQSYCIPFVQTLMLKYAHLRVKGEKNS